jgi:hypothetical protein
MCIGLLCFEEKYRKSKFKIVYYPISNNQNVIHNTPIVGIGYNYYSTVIIVAYGVVITVS